MVSLQKKRQYSEFNPGRKVVQTEATEGSGFGSKTRGTGETDAGLEDRVQGARLKDAHVRGSDHRAQPYREGALNP